MLRVQLGRTGAAEVGLSSFAGLLRVPVSWPDASPGAQRYVASAAGTFLGGAGVLGARGFCFLCRSFLLFGVDLEEGVPFL